MIHVRIYHGFPNFTVTWLKEYERVIRFSTFAGLKEELWCCTLIGMTLVQVILHDWLIRQLLVLVLLGFALSLSDLCF